MISLYSLKQAWNSLKKSPTLISNIAITIGVTVGALICALTLAYFMLLKPLPYPEQHQLFLVNNQMLDELGEHRSAGFSYKQAEYLYKHHQQQSMALVYHANDVITSHNDQPNIDSAYVSPEWFSVLGTPFELGHGFTDDQGVGQFSPKAVISFTTWHKYFDGSKEILERSVTIRGVSYQIIGVTAKRYNDPEIFTTGTTAQIWLPWDYNWSQQMKWGDWQQIENNIQVITKVNSDNNSNLITHQLTSQLNHAWQAQMISVPQYRSWQLKLTITPLITAIFGEQQKLIYYIVFACLGIFIIAIANTINLLLSHTYQQHNSLSICIALGARKGDINRQIYTEILIIALMSLPITLFTVVAGFTVLKSELGALLPRVSELSLGIFSISTALILLLIVCVIFSKICQSTLNYRALRKAITASGKGTSSQIKKSVRHSLIVSQVCITTLLVFMNLSLFNNAYNKITEPMGFSVQNRYQLKLSAKDPLQQNTTIKNDLLAIKQMLSQNSAIEKVSVSLSPLQWFGQFAVIDSETQKKYVPETKFVDENYFGILNQPMLNGDNFTRQQISQRQNVVIINDVFAKILTNNGDVLSRTLEYWGSKHKIIGIVKGIKRPNELTVPARRYTPDMGTRPNLMIQFKPQSILSKQQIMSAIKTVSSQYDVYSYTAMSEDKTRLLFNQYTIATVTAVLTVLTIFLAAIGLFGILSYSSQMRRFEIGTRMAIGAKGKDIVYLIISENLTALMIGVSLCVFIILLANIGFSDHVSSVIKMSNAWLFLMTITVISLIAFLACYLPLKKYISLPTIENLRGVAE